MKQVPAPNFETIATPGAIVRQLEGKSIAELAGLYRRAESATVRGWMVMACIVGVALQKAKYGEHGADELAAEFGCSSRTIVRLAAVFSKLIRPRIEISGDRARSPLDQRQFYLISLEGAEATGKPPLALLEEAEKLREKDPRFTARAFKRRVYGEERTAREPRLLGLVRKLAQVMPVTAERSASSGDPAELEALITAASERLAVARRSLHRGRTAA